MRLLLATDAWHPQVNGVVRTLSEMERRGPDHGLEIRVVAPRQFRTIALPGYPEIRLAIAPGSAIRRLIAKWRPDAIHIATEGPIGLAARRLALRLAVPFTTSYHTRFPEYLRARLPVPERMTYAWLRRFHNAGSGIMCATQSLEHDLTQRGFRRLMRWSRGVDLTMFHPRDTAVLDLPRPIFLNVGRVAVEKNLEAFLSLDLPGTKVVVGDGPARADLMHRFPAAHFIGAQSGEDLAQIYASADVFVFPSLTDTFGLVLIEALASGLPVAAFPVMGPRDIIGEAPAGVLGEDLRQSALAALRIDPAACIAVAERYSWAASARQFAANVREAYDDFHAARSPAEASPPGMEMVGRSVPLANL